MFRIERHKYFKGLGGTLWLEYGCFGLSLYFDLLQWTLPGCVEIDNHAGVFSFHLKILCLGLGLNWLEDETSR